MHGTNAAHSVMGLQHTPHRSDVLEAFVASTGTAAAATAVVCVVKRGDVPMMHSYSAKARLLWRSYTSLYAPRPNTPSAKVQSHRGKITRDAASRSSVSVTTRLACFANCSRRSNVGEYSPGGTNLRGSLCPPNSLRLSLSGVKTCKKQRQDSYAKITHKCKHCATRRVTCAKRKGDFAAQLVAAATEKTLQT